MSQKKCNNVMISEDKSDGLAKVKDKSDDCMISKYKWYHRDIKKENVINLLTRKTDMLWWK